MKLIPLLVLLLIGTAGAQARDQVPAIAIHGGAGTMDPASLTPEIQASVEEALTAALTAGYGVLEDGGSALDGVVAAIVTLEDSPWFNAGRGAVFTHDGRNELDASLMDGHTLAAGAVGGVRLVKNPILLARRVMENSPHVLLTGDGALEFALREGIETRPPEYFHTDRRWRQLIDARNRKQASLPPADRMGTVGAVALDARGRLAAGTSTGGMTNKRWGRLGDTPIIGAGTYASDVAGCAVSATGHGEYFIRAAVAHDICARAEYGGQSVAEAAGFVIRERLVEMGGTGGVISIDGDGRIAMPFNTSGMYRGAVTTDGEMQVAIYQTPGRE